MSTPEQPTSNVLRSVDLTSNLSPDASTRSDVVSALSLGVDIPDGVATTWLDRGSFPSDVSESAVREREAALARKAERQYGVFSGSQAQEAGFPRRTIYERVRRGSWVRVSGDSYRVAASAETWQQPIVAAWLAVGDPSAISGRSALAVWQLATPMPAVPQITVPWTRRPRLTGVRVVRTRRWTRKDIVRLGTLRVTSVRRTLLDVAPHFSELDLETVVDAAHRRKLLDLEQVAAYLRKARKAKIPGASKLAFLVGLRVGNRPLESVAETLLFRTLRRAGLPAPTPQYWVRTRSGDRRIDFAYPSERIGIEVDGYAPHSGRPAFEADRTRYNELADAGWELRHMTWTMLTERPGDVVWTIASALGLEPTGWRPRRGSARR